MFHVVLGTGKTRVLVEMVAETMYQKTRNTGKNPKILVCAPSSTAINEIAGRLANKFPQKNKRTSSVNPVNSKLIRKALFPFSCLHFRLIVLIVFVFL
jgi:superfamily I DNA and/or RNA helicase